MFCISSTNQMQSPDEEDFDQFLENVKARSLSVQKQQGEVLSSVTIVHITLHPHLALV